MSLVVFDLSSRSQFCLIVAIKLFLHGLNVVAMNISFVFSMLSFWFSFDLVRKSFGFLSLTILSFSSMSLLG